jgi:5-methyltetrahydrofolate--homocysteine methyltransferase
MQTTLSGTRKTVTIGPGLPTVIIGERINPTGKKRLAAALAAGDLGLVREMAQAQVATGADVLDVNVGIAGGDEVTLLRQAVQAVAEVVDVPICIDTANPQALEAALQVAPGRPLVNSVNAEDKSLRAVLPLVKKYGAAVIALPMDERGIPKNAATRLQLATKLLECAESYGIPREDVVIDGLMLTVGAEGQSGHVTLETVRRVREQLGLNVNLGVSNVSFGLPDRPLINQTFLAMAIAAGMNCAIVDPTSMCSTVRAADLLLGHDEYATRYISHYRKTQKAAAVSKPPPKTQKA